MRNLLSGRKKIIYIFLILIFGFIWNLNNKPESRKASVKIQSSQRISPKQEVKSAKEEPSPPISGSAEKTLAQHPDRLSARVVRVRDGDTIEVDFGMGDIKVVRYIGIDTPESVDPRRSVECFGKEASNMNNSLVGGKTVLLEKDVSETDKYGRLLRYVYLPAGRQGLGDLFINQYLVGEGFANASAYPPDVKYQEDLESAEEEARLDNKGLWSSCPSTSGSSSSQINNSSAGDKDCSDFSTYQEAQDYFNSKGGSATNNVDRLDGSDHDGQVCEMLR